MHKLAAAVLILGLVVSCGPPRAGGSRGAMVETTMRFRIDGGNVVVVQADGPSNRLKKECLGRVKGAVAAGHEVGEDVGDGVREFVCFDFFPR